MGPVLCAYREVKDRVTDGALVWYSDKYSHALEAHYDDCRVGRFGSPSTIVYMYCVKAIMFVSLDCFCRAHQSKFLQLLQHHDGANAAVLNNTPQHPTLFGGDIHQSIHLRLATQFGCCCHLQKALLFSEGVCSSCDLVWTHDGAISETRRLIFRCLPSITAISSTTSHSSQRRVIHSLISWAKSTP